MEDPVPVCYAQIQAFNIDINKPDL